MCLAVPAKVIKIEGKRVLVDALGEKSKVKINPSERQPSVGDYVLVQFGMITDTLDKKTAEENLKAWKDILKQSYSK